MASATHRVLGRPQCATTARAQAPVRGCRRFSVQCKAANEPAPARRDVLLAGAAAAAAAVLLPAQPAAAAMREMAVSSLSTFQKGAQRAAFQAAAEKVLRERFTAPDAPGLLRLILHDAATYDADAGVGGFDGSILLSREELDRPENAPLKPLVSRLLEAKAEVDAAVNPAGGPISAPDLLVLACKVATQASWKQTKMKRVTTTSGGEIITTVYGTEWPVRLGRAESAAPGPAGRLPADNAPVADIVAYMKGLGVKGGAEASSGPFARKPPFWERPTFFMWPASQDDPAAAEARFVTEDPAAFSGVKTDCDRSRGTLTRTDYEVEFINTFTKLTAMGATFSPDAYLHSEETLAIKY